MFRRLVVVNRGVAAMRLIHAVRELNEEREVGIRLIVLHTHHEQQAMFVREADEAILIGGASGGGAARSDPYLDHSELQRALRQARADAVWVGWGLVAEDPAFADLCQRMGITFVGPDGIVMRRLGDRIGARLLAEEANVPVAPWSRGPVENVEDALLQGRRIGYPLMIKAASGAGGQGSRLALDEDHLRDAFEGARAEAHVSSGDHVVFIEKHLSGAHHVEVQVVGDSHGTTWALGIRDCSLRRDNHRLLEESRPALLTPEQDVELRAAAVRIARVAGYRNAGTVEFLYQPRERAFSFLGFVASLQVDHPVTEMTTGVDLVKLQLDVASGGRLEAVPPGAIGHAIQARLSAEDPDRAFAPAPGTVQLMALPTGPGIRIDTGVAEGDDMPPGYDLAIANIIAWGGNRDEARARLRRALSQTAIVISGGTGNKGLLLELLDRPEVRSGTADTGWLDRVGNHATRARSPHAAVALVAAAIDAFDAESVIDQARFLASAARGRPRAGLGGGQVVEFVCQRNLYRVAVGRSGPDGQFQVEVEGAMLRVLVARLGPFASRIQVAGQVFKILSTTQGAEHLVEVDGIPHRISRRDGGFVRSPAPSLVVAVKVKPGDLVDAGSVVAVVESMKMETSILAPISGRVREVFVDANIQVDAGGALLRMEAADGGESEATPADRVDLEHLVTTSSPGANGRDLCLERLNSMRFLVLGFDFQADDARRLVGDYRRLRQEVPPDDAEVLHAELEILGIFADLAALSRNRRAADDEAVEEAHSPREFFRIYLRSLDIDREGLPASFRDRLLRALRHYGVHDLARSRQLEASLYRIFLAQDRGADQLSTVLALLDTRLQSTDALPDALRHEFRDTLDRLIVASQVRYPLVGANARAVRFRVHDQPLMARARARTFTEMREHLAYLSSHPGASDYSERFETLVACPQLLVRLLADHTGPGESAVQEPLLEVLTRRYYKVRHLENLNAVTFEGRRFVTADYQQDGHDLHVVTCMAEMTELGPAANGLVRFLRQHSAPRKVVVDFYTWSKRPLLDIDGSARTIRAVIEAAALPEVVGRVAVAAVSRGPGGDGDSEVPIHQFTFRRGAGGFAEDLVLRGLHPMIARRLHLWRLAANFRIRRLPSDEDVYLFDCVAHDNPADERLIALAEVRDLTPVRDHQGRVTELPELERMLAASLDAVRAAYLERPRERRPQWNRILLYVWPGIDAQPLDELLPLASTIAPMTQGLGLEQVMIQGRMAQPPSGKPRDMVLRLSFQPGGGLTVRLNDTPAEPLKQLDAYTQKVVLARRRGLVYPYEILPMLTRSEEAGPLDASTGSVVEYDLDDSGNLAPVTRPPGGNTAGLVVALVSRPTRRYPEGIKRVALLSDPLQALGAVAEPECRRVMAALDMAERMHIPVEWIAVSAGAKISMESGSEHMDWIGRVLRRIIEFTQAGGEINVVVAGINVGAQPYWNAEATMLMHTRGILVMTPDSAQVLTGKLSLEYSGGVTAEDNFGIGGYERIMGPNGQSQYWAPDLAAACELLLTHYQHTYVAPGERFPRPAATQDPFDRDIRSEPHAGPGTDFATVGEIFSDVSNPGRKKPFDIRSVMRATIDHDHPPLERWPAMRGAGTVVVFDAHLGGNPVCLVGIESRPLARHGRLSPDGPDQWTAGTLFPMSSKKMARTINAASGNRPVVILANLSGFDGSPESLRGLQLEYGAEIGRAVVNFRGPIIFCVVSRYHGGAFVVFSATLNDNIETIALEGSYASVIGGAPAAAVVFTGEVNARVRADRRFVELEAQIAAAPTRERTQLQGRQAELTAALRSEKLGEVAAEFDAEHSVERALRVGSVHQIIPAARLRPYLVEAVQRGIQRTAGTGPVQA
jgi:acetyl/propionyl-CoA carboxylase alpha subunit/acetyl-CoA carboxylase carboxyltransferase component